YRFFLVRDHTARNHRRRNEKLKSHGTTRCRPWSKRSRVSGRPGAAPLRLLDGAPAGLPQRPRRLEPFDPRDVRGRPGAFGLSRREIERGALAVDRPGLAVDPAEAERLLDRRVVVDPRPRGHLLPRHEPDAVRTVVIRLEPRAPRGPVVELDPVGVAHVSSSASA